MCCNICSLCVKKVESKNKSQTVAEERKNQKESEKEKKKKGNKTGKKKEKEKKRRKIDKMSDAEDPILESYNVLIDRTCIFQALSQLKYKAVSAHDNDGCSKTCKQHEKSFLT